MLENLSVKSETNVLFCCNFIKLNYLFVIDRYDEGGQFGPNGMMVSLGERVITIEGAVDAICEAEKIISQRLRDYMEKDLRNSSNNSNMV